MNSSGAAALLQKRASLEAMQLMALHRLAEGLGEVAVDACMDGGDAKASLVELLLAEPETDTMTPADASGTGGA